MSGKPKLARGQVLEIETGWRETVLICRKCSKKLSGGFGEDDGQTLRTALRERLRETGRRGDVRILEVGCFGICPKRAVTVCRGREPGRLLVFGVGADPGLLIGSDARSPAAPVPGDGGDGPDADDRRSGPA